ncbi:MAG: hypothetical protein IJD97_12235 [Clostridia bacterium]|nr:hypothetical protein [Clostridia bacterium]
MSTLVLILVILGVALQNIVKKAYNIKVGGGVFVFSGASAAIAALFFIFSSIGTFEYSAEFLPYSVGFSVFYSMGVAFSVLAILTGPLSLTSLISSYSLIIPAIYGIMNGDEVDGILIGGIILLLISLVFVNMEKKDDKKITLKWAIFAFLAFLGNGGCSTVQTAQQQALDGKYKNEFMIIALLITAFTLFAVAFFTKERKTIGTSLKKGFPWYAVCGIANGAVNLFVMMLVSVYKMAPSVMFPLVSAGGIIVTVAVSMTLYKEKLTPCQIIGVILGTGAVVLLNL